MELNQQIIELLSNGLGSKGDEEQDPTIYPERPLHILIATSGSVASIKLPLIVRELLKFRDVEVQVIATQRSLHFFDAPSLESEYLDKVKVWTDTEEWASWNKIGDPVLHIELRRWTDVVLIAPCSANTLAKINHGICDTILTSFLRALPTFVPVYLFPAMNTHMFSHPLTSIQLDMVRDVLGYKVHGPIGKRLACGDIGIGAMFEWNDIVKLMVDQYKLTLK